MKGTAAGVWWDMAPLSCAVSSGPLLLSMQLWEAARVGTSFFSPGLPGAGARGSLVCRRALPSVNLYSFYVSFSPYVLHEKISAVRQQGPHLIYWFLLHLG